MATGTTTTADLIVPEVWADAVGPTILGKAVWATLALTDTTLTGQPGNRVNMPKWKYIGDADELTEGVAMDTTKMEMVDSWATIKEAGKAVELTDNATLEALGNPDSQARTQLALSVARKIDTDLRAAALYEHTNAGEDDDEATTAPLKLADANLPMSWNRFTRAIALLGDEYDPSELAGVVITSTQHAQLLNDPKFISSESFGADAVLMRGQVGRIGTVPILVSDRGIAANATRHLAIIVKRGALSLKYKRQPIVETDRDILKRTNIITTNVHYGVKRTDDRGIIVIPTNVVVPEDEVAA